MTPSLRHPKTLKEKKQLIKLKDELKEEGFNARNRDLSRFESLPTLYDDILPSSLKNKRDFMEWYQQQKERLKSFLQSVNAPEKIERELPSTQKEAVYLAKIDKQTFSEIPSEMFGLTYDLFEAYQEEFLA